ncbi:hypothetical protein BC628DRAFT_1201672 [Trametes gibbosa]|nr:hypothetical protein BC628DRAFT_1201672 [Trametes gibbosa]
MHARSTWSPAIAWCFARKSRLALERVRPTTPHSCESSRRTARPATNWGVQGGRHPGPRRLSVSQHRTRPRSGPAHDRATSSFVGGIPRTACPLIPRRTPPRALATSARLPPQRARRRHTPAWYHTAEQGIARLPTHSTLSEVQRRMHRTA